MIDWPADIGIGIGAGIGIGIGIDIGAGIGIGIGIGIGAGIGIGIDIGAGIDHITSYSQYTLYVRRQSTFVSILHLQPRLGSVTLNAVTY